VSNIKFLMSNSKTLISNRITVIMFNLKQNEEITKDLILKDKLIWCRLMFAIYIKSSNGEYESVSPPVYSDLIEHSMTLRTSFTPTIPKAFFNHSSWTSITCI
jgi:hypothetical protein